jgi:hypothetical protein
VNQATVKENAQVHERFCERTSWFSKVEMGGGGGGVKLCLLCVMCC